MERRDFLVSIFGVSSLLFIKSSTPKISARSKLIMGDGHDKPKSSLIVAELGGGEVHTIPTPCAAHEVLKDPRSNLLIGSAQWHKEMYVADLNTLKLIKDIKCPESESFSGHSLFSSDNQHFLTSMINSSSWEGYISIRESKTLREVKRIPTYGGNPHQMHWVVQDKIVGVINSKPQYNEKDQNQSFLNFINIENGELIKSSSTNMGRFTHFSFARNFQSAIMFRSATPETLSLFQMVDLDNGNAILNKEVLPILTRRTEGLNHLLFEDQSLAVINIVGINKTIFWDYKNNKVLFEKTYDDKPMGIVMDEKKENVYIAFIKDKMGYISMYRARDFFNYKIEPYSTVLGGNGVHLNII